MSDSKCTLKLKKNENYLADKVEQRKFSTPRNINEILKKKDIFISDSKSNPKSFNGWRMKPRTIKIHSFLQEGKFIFNEILKRFELDSSPIKQGFTNDYFRKLTDLLNKKHYKPYPKERMELFNQRIHKQKNRNQYDDVFPSMSSLLPSNRIKNKTFVTLSDETNRPLYRNINNNNEIKCFRTYCEYNRSLSTNNAEKSKRKYYKRNQNHYYKTNTNFFTTISTNDGERDREKNKEKVRTVLSVPNFSEDVEKICKEVFGEEIKFQTERNFYRNRNKNLSRNKNDINSLNYNPFTVNFPKKKENETKYRSPDIIARDEYLVNRDKKSLFRIFKR